MIYLIQNTTNYSLDVNKISDGKSGSIDNNRLAINKKPNNKPIYQLIVSLCLVTQGHGRYIIYRNHRGDISHLKNSLNCVFEISNSHASVQIRFYSLRMRVRPPPPSPTRNQSAAWPLQKDAKFDFDWNTRALTHTYLCHVMPPQNAATFPVSKTFSTISGWPKMRKGWRNWTKMNPKSM